METKNDIQLSFGAELEWSDVDRQVDIPSCLGSWEGPKIAGFNLGSELDIVNTKGKWRGIATDPLCISCPVGGEIHVNPSFTIDSQLIRIMRIMGLFDMLGVACPNHGHIHVGVPGLRDNLDLLKNVFKYTEKNGVEVLRNCCGYDKEEYLKIISDSNLKEWTKKYLTVGDAKTISDILYKRVADSFSAEEALYWIKKTTAVDYDWVQDSAEATVNSHRTTVNLFNLTKANTIEFRVFRASINPAEIYSTLLFSKRYVEEALKGSEGKPVSDILQEGLFRFPRLNFNSNLAQGWQNTRLEKNRSACLKHYTGFCQVSEDPLIAFPNSSLQVEEEGLLIILDLCKRDVQTLYTM